MVILPILIGGLIYVGYRTDTLIMFDWFDSLGLGAVIQEFRIYINGLNVRPPNWFIYSLPDGLWVYAFTSAILLIWNGRLSWWIIIPLITGVFVEIAQAFHLFKGTFDYVDLLLSISAFFSSILILKTKNYEKKLC